MCLRTKLDKLSLNHWIQIGNIDQAELLVLMLVY